MKMAKIGDITLNKITVCFLFKYKTNTTMLLATRCEWISRLRKRRDQQLFWKQQLQDGRSCWVCGEGRTLGAEGTGHFQYPRLPNVRRRSKSCSSDDKIMGASSLNPKTPTHDKLDHLVIFIYLKYQNL